MKLRYFSFLLFLSFWSTQNVLLAQNTENVWRTLALMKFERQYSENDGIGQQQGRFVPIIEALEGKEITLKGYVIPLTGKKAQSHFMFSAYPFSDCFFCGKAGPESVVEAFTKDEKKIAFSDDAITIKGIFKFTSRDPNDIMFTVENVELVD
ncbi:MAG: DUF3299 domain-containing protein [Saprospiraceae bacterium]